jgi:hypothetical protein
MMEKIEAFTPALRPTQPHDSYPTIPSEIVSPTAQLAGRAPRTV